jgi:hypothetical protein
MPRKIAPKTLAARLDALALHYRRLGRHDRARECARLASALRSGFLKVDDVPAFP